MFLILFKLQIYLTFKLIMNGNLFEFYDNASRIVFRLSVVFILEQLLQNIKINDMRGCRSPQTNLYSTIQNEYQCQRGAISTFRYSTININSRDRVMHIYVKIDSKRYSCLD